MQHPHYSPARWQILNHAVLANAGKQHTRKPRSQDQLFFFGRTSSYYPKRSLSTCVSFSLHLLTLLQNVPGGNLQSKSGQEFRFAFSREQMFKTNSKEDSLFTELVRSQGEKHMEYLFSAPPDSKKSRTFAMIELNVC